MSLIIEIREITNQHVLVKCPRVKNNNCSVNAFLFFLLFFSIVLSSTSYSGPWTNFATSRTITLTHCMGFCLHFHN